MKTRFSRLKGLIPPMVTPLIDNNTLDRDGTVRLVEHMIAGGVHGIFILGTTGEAQSLAYHLRYELTELVCSAVAGRVPVLVGVTDTSLEESLRLAHKAAECGAAAVVAAPPLLFRSFADGTDHVLQGVGRCPCRCLCASIICRCM